MQDSSAARFAVKVFALSDLNVSGRVFSFAFSTLIVHLGCGDVGMPGKLLDLFHPRSVLQGIRQSRLSQTVNADPRETAESSSETETRHDPSPLLCRWIGAVV